jgi:hypothetical protein
LRERILLPYIARLVGDPMTDIFSGLLGALFAAIAYEGIVNLA